MSRIGRLVSLGILAAFLILGSSLAFLFWVRLNPNVLRPYLQAKLSEWLKGKAELGSMSFSWREKLGMKIEGLKVQDLAGGKGFLGAGSLVLRVNPFIFWDQKRFWDRLEMGEGRLRYQAGGRLPFKLDIKGITAELKQGISGNLILSAEGRLLSNAESDLQVQAKMNPSRQRLDFEIHFQKDKILLGGEVLPFQKPFRLRGNAVFNQVDCDTLYLFLQDRGEIPKLLSGRITGELVVEGGGMEPADFRNRLQGQGRLEIQNGAFRNFNLVHSLLRRLPLWPVLHQVLMGATLPPFQSILGDRDTSFELLQTEFLIEGGQVKIPSLILKSHHYLVKGEGQLGFQGELNFQGQLVLLEEMSQFLVGRVHELSSLQNPQGRIVIPFIYRGEWPTARPRPDLASLSEKLILETFSQWREHWGKGETR